MKYKSIKKIKGWQIALTITLMLFGFLITAQYRTNVAVNSSLESQTLEDLSTLVVNLDEKRSELKQEQAELDKSLQSLQTKTNEGVSLTETLKKQIERLEIITGEKAVKGPGISVTITGESLLMYYDMIDLVNELFNAGAEAVSVNDVRIQLSTKFGEKYSLQNDQVLLMNGEPLLSPIIIRAIGDPDTLETALTFSGGIISNLNTLYQVYPTVKKMDEVRIPAVKVK